MPAAPLLVSTSCLDLSVNTQGQAVVAPVVDLSDPSSALADRDTGLYAPALLTAACVARADGLNVFHPAPLPDVAAETWTLSYTNTDIDTDGMFDNAAPTLLTIRTAGLYAVAATFSVPSPTTGVTYSEAYAGLGVLLERGGHAPELIASSAFKLDNGLGASCSRVLDLVPGDQLRAVVQAWVAVALEAFSTIATGGLHQRAGALSAVGCGLA